MSSAELQGKSTKGRIVRDEDCVIIASEPYADDIRRTWFDPDVWGSNAQPVSSGGRGTAWFVHHGDKQWVLRHYSRGGMAARLSKYSYLYAGNDRVRSIAEFRLLKWLYEQNLPVPAPVGACYRRLGGCFYQAAILIERLDDAKPFQALLDSSDADLWYQVGRLIRRFHDAGVDHPDLNCYNILVSSSDLYLIDFDKGKVRPKSAKNTWKKKNLDRLKRSIEKLSPRIENWQLLMQGYKVSENQAFDH